VLAEVVAVAQPFQAGAVEQEAVVVLTTTAYIVLLS